MLSHAKKQEPMSMTTQEDDLQNHGCVEPSYKKRILAKNRLLRCAICRLLGLADSTPKIDYGGSGKLVEIPDVFLVLEPISDEQVDRKQKGYAEIPHCGMIVEQLLLASYYNTQPDQPLSQSLACKSFNKSQINPKQNEEKYCVEIKESSWSCHYPGRNVGQRPLSSYIARSNAI